MKMKLYHWFLIVIFLSSANLARGQQVHSSKMAPVILHYEIDGFIGNTHVPEGGQRDTDGTLILPNIGLNFKYWIDDKFAIGWYNNIVARTFVVNSDSHQDLDREYPFITSFVGIFKPWKNLSFFAGPGVEIEKNQSLFVIRLGIDYAFSLSNDWYISPRFIFDHLGGDIEAYTIGVSIGRKF